MFVLSFYCIFLTNIEQPAIKMMTKKKINVPDLQQKPQPTNRNHNNNTRKNATTSQQREEERGGGGGGGGQKGEGVIFNSYLIVHTTVETRFSRPTLFLGDSTHGALNRKSQCTTSAWQQSPSGCQSIQWSSQEVAVRRG